MTCNRCPHHVRHGTLGPDKKTIIFSNLCGLKVKQQVSADPTPKKPRGRGRPAAEYSRPRPLAESETTACIHHPFPDPFDYFACAVYQGTFNSKGMKNGVVPTKDFQYSDQIGNVSVTDMELL